MGMQVETFKVGSYHVTRIEEMLTPGFTAAFLLPDFDVQVMEEHPILAGERFHAATSFADRRPATWPAMSEDFT